MKNLTLVFLLLWSSLAFSNAKVVGNGGSIVICKDETNKIIKSELFDLYEGRALRGTKYQEDSTPYLVQAQSKITQLLKSLNQKASVDGSIQKKFEFISQKLFFLPEGTGLKPVDDIDEFIFPKNCELVQTINFRNDYKIYVDTDIWNILSETQKAALLVHETIYWYLREAGLPKGNLVEINSIRTRKAVSLLFSGVIFENYLELKDLKSSFKPQYCRTVDALENDRESTHFYIHQNNEDKFIFQFINIIDRVLLTRANLQNNSIIIDLHSGVYADGHIKSIMDNDFFVDLRWWPTKPDLNKIFVRGPDQTTSWETFTCEDL